MGRSEIIHGDRRGERRYAYEMELQFSYTLGGVQRFGSGLTVDLSRGAVRFVADDPPPEGSDVELRIAWPYLLQNVCPLELIVRGKTRAVSDRGTVLTISRYEFRTCGQRSFVSAATGVSGSGILA
ncbi:MAG TPA: PilZ domain-containing protein [Bryobacteraceae bacterium]|nr:PilZ domain-containing protein [Bryobacteraceae bacterium]